VKGYRMHQAKILKQQGMKNTRIAELLGIDRRTVYNYLNNTVFQDETASAGRPRGSRKLAPFFALIEQSLERDIFVSGDIVFQKMALLGYTGKTTILYDYLKKRREELTAYAVMRFETIAGEQAQVDWAECGFVWENGVRRKRYCFVMKLGYSRRTYMEFTTSMKQPILFACMKRAFAYFGGIPQEILFDNMKTAFLYDHQQCRWVAHPRMLAFAAHYGFTPKRCRVRRPQTKGKVEREIRYLRSSFFPSLRLDGIDITATATDKLNEHVREWLCRVDRKVIREFGESRLERFERDYRALRTIPVHDFDHRIIEPLKVSMDGKITFHTNRYSVDASFRGKMLEGKYDPDTGIMTLCFEGKEIKTVLLFPQGVKGERIEPQDKQSLYEAWRTDRERYEKRMKRRIEKKKRRARLENGIVHPCVYDKLFGIPSSQPREVEA